MFLFFLCLELIKYLDRHLIMHHDAIVPMYYKYCQQPPASNIASIRRKEPIPQTDLELKAKS